MSDDDFSGYLEKVKRVSRRKTDDEMEKAEGGEGAEEVEVGMLADLVFDPTAQPKRGIDRLVGGQVAKKFLSVLSGYGGQGKSSLLYGLACGMAAGTQFVGHEVHRQCRVMYLQMEDDQDMISRSLSALAQRHTLSREALADRLVAVGSDSLATLLNLRRGLQYLIPSSEGVPEVNSVMRRRLAALIKAHKSDVLIIDPLAVLYGGMQMSNEASNVLARDLGELAKELDIAIVVTSHQRKPTGQNTQSNQHDVKHGAELVDTSRSVWNLMPLAKSLIDEWSVNVDPEELEEVRQCVVTKTNIGKTGARFYFRLREAEVQCADGKLESVAVVVHWMPPTVQRFAEPWMIEAIRKEIEENFIVPRKVGRTTRRSLIDVLKDMDQNINALKVAEDMEARGWVIVTEEIAPGSKNRHAVKRVRIGVVNDE